MLRCIEELYVSLSTPNRLGPLGTGAKYRCESKFFFFFCGHIGPRSCKSAVVILFTCGYKIEYLIYFILPEVF